MSDRKKLSMIVAASENDVIGVGGDLPWRLSADLKRFKRLTMGHWIIMGRKTFDSIGRLLPGRTTVVVTRNADLKIAGAVMAASVDQALRLCRPDASPFVVGGGEIYRLAMPYVTDLFLTRVHTEIAGDTFMPRIDWEQWESVQRTDHHADEKNSVDYSFEVFRKSSVDRRSWGQG